MAIVSRQTANCVASQFDYTCAFVLFIDCPRSRIRLVHHLTKIMIVWNTSTVCLPRYLVALMKYDTLSHTHQQIKHKYPVAKAINYIGCRTFQLKSHQKKYTYVSEKYIYTGNEQCNHYYIS